MIPAELAGLPASQRDRLAFIELHLYYVGEVQRQDLVDRFGVQSAAATRDLAVYRRIAPENLSYDTRARAYVLGEDFKPIFEFTPERVLAWIAQCFGDGEPGRVKSWMVAEIPSRLTQPSLATLSCVTRAIHSQSPLRIRYNSITAGVTERTIVPFALIDNGQRWHVRGFDRLRGEFRDFVITRIQDPVLLKGESVAAHEHRDQDIQWTRIVELDLVPHPDQPRPEVTVMDYGMQDGHLRVRLRAATAGYVLRCWNVDCSADHSLRSPEIRLWLNDPLTLYGVSNAVLAPGYEAPVANRGKQ